MLTFAKRQHAVENGMSIEHVQDEVDKSLFDDALKFANMGQQDLVPYEPSDIDEEIEYEESDKLLRLRHYLNSRYHRIKYDGILMEV